MECSPPPSDRVAVRDHEVDALAGYRQRRYLTDDRDVWAYEAGVEIGLAGRVGGETADSEVEIAVADGTAVTTAHQRAFLAGSEGRRRAALAACAALWRRLGPGPPG